MGNSIPPMMINPCRIPSWKHRGIDCFSSSYRLHVITWCDHPWDFYEFDWILFESLLVCLWYLWRIYPFIDATVVAHSSFLHNFPTKNSKLSKRQSDVIATMSFQGLAEFSYVMLVGCVMGRALGNRTVTLRRKILTELSLRNVLWLSTEPKREPGNALWIWMNIWDLDHRSEEISIDSSIPFVWLWVLLSLSM